MHVQHKAFEAYLTFKMALIKLPLYQVMKYNELRYSYVSVMKNSKVQRGCQTLISDQNLSRFKGRALGVLTEFSPKKMRGRANKDLYPQKQV